jgi:hypothetical protein
MEYLGYFLSIIIGLSLGLIGGGGSILAVPILVYLFKIHPEQATSYSLFVVGITAMYGSYGHYKLGNLKIKAALIFALPSVISLLFVRDIILPKIPSIIFTGNDFVITKNLMIMVVFAFLMIMASISMIRESIPKEIEKCDNSLKIAIIGLFVGFITGFLGAGGGFLIIPALLFFANLPMKQAIGTSLLIIFINSIIGFGGDMLNESDINYELLFTISSIALVGMFTGTYLSKKIDGDKLKPAFGWFVLVVGIFIIIKEFFI